MSKVDISLDVRLNCFVVGGAGGGRGGGSGGGGGGRT